MQHSSIVHPSSSLFEALPVELKWEVFYALLLTNPHSQGLEESIIHSIRTKSYVYCVDFMDTFGLEVRTFSSINKQCRSMMEPVLWHSRTLDLSFADHFHYYADELVNRAGNHLRVLNLSQWKISSLVQSFVTLPKSLYWPIQSYLTNNVSPLATEHHDVSTLIEKNYNENSLAISAAWWDEYCATLLQTVVSKAPHLAVILFGFPVCAINNRVESTHLKSLRFYEQDQRIGMRDGVMNMVFVPTFQLSPALASLRSTLIQKSKQLYLYCNTGGRCKGHAATPELINILVSPARVVTLSMSSKSAETPTAKSNDLIPCFSDNLSSRTVYPLWYISSTPSPIITALPIDCTIHLTRLKIRCSSTRFEIRHVINIVRNSPRLVDLQLIGAMEPPSHEVTVNGRPSSRVVRKYAKQLLTSILSLRDLISLKVCNNMFFADAMFEPAQFDNLSTTYVSILQQQKTRQLSLFAPARPHRVARDAMASRIKSPSIYQRSSVRPVTRHGKADKDADPYCHSLDHESQDRKKISNTGQKPSFLRHCSNHTNSMTKRDLPVAPDEQPRGLRNISILYCGGLTLSGLVDFIALFQVTMHTIEFEGLSTIDSQAFDLYLYKWVKEVHEINGRTPNCAQLGHNNMHYPTVANLHFQRLVHVTLTTVSSPIALLLLFARSPLQSVELHVHSDMPDYFHDWLFFFDLFGRTLRQLFVQNIRPAGVHRTEAERQRAREKQQKIMMYAASVGCASTVTY